MSSPLLDVDATARPAASKPTKSSKLPSMSTAQRNGSSGRPSPFSVSATGSPRYTGISPLPRTIASPTVASKLPRKSQTPTQVSTPRILKPSGGAVSQRSSLPIRGARTSLSTNTPTYSGTKQLSPPLSRNKPLPSPPIVQIVDPSSPPKAQRTLVDAECGSPSGDEWPILRPENVSPPKKIDSSADKTDVQQQRSVSEGAAPRQIANSYFSNRGLTPAVRIGTGTTPTKQPLPAQGASSCYPKFLQMTEPRAFTSKNPYANAFHAISTETEAAVQSPLAHKNSASAKIPIPPRISSKRSSLPLPNQLKPDSPTLSPSLQSGDAKFGCTEWPLLEKRELAEAVAESTPSLPEQQTLAATQNAQDDIHRASEISDTYHTTRSQPDSVKSNSTWSLAAGSSLDEEPEQNYENNIRVKRLSWRSSTSGSGPVLTIFQDADAVLFGRSNSVPDVPALPDKVLENAPQERSLSTLASRISKQTMSRISVSKPSRSPTPKATELRASPTTPVKINPIRSMQPPRKASSEVTSPALPSSVSDMFINPNKAGELPLLSSKANRNASGASQKAFGSMPNSEPVVADTSESAESPSQTAITVKEPDDADLEPAIASKAGKLLRMNQETPPSKDRKGAPTSWMPSSLSSRKNKEVNSIRSKTSPSLNTVGGLSVRDATSDSSTSHSVSPTLARTAQSHDAVRSSGPSKLRASESAATPDGVRTSSKRGSPSSRQKKSQRFTPVSSPSPFGYTPTKMIDIKKDSQTKETTTKKVKVKRSFRDIFLKRDNKRTEKPPALIESRQGFMTGTRSSLAKRIRDSTNLSKVHVSTMPEAKSKPEVQNNAEPDSITIINEVPPTTKDVDRHAALSSLEAASSSPTQEASPVPHYDTASVVTNIIDRVTAMPTDSPHRLRGLEIAEAILNSIECYREAKLNAEMARKHARDAELNAERAGVELHRLQKLCEPNFDGETLQAINELINVVGSADHQGEKEGGGAAPGK